VENLKTFFKDNYKEIFHILGIFFIFICLFQIISGHQGNLIVDCGRETYIPSEILKGKVLYKDIFNTYGPFAYQLNSLAFLLFGEKIHVLYLFGAINSLIIILTIYLISRSVASIYTSIITQIMIITICIFSSWIFNYIFPYSYSALYALSTFLLSLLFAIYYLKYSNPKFALLSSFFIGISLTSKQEYAAFLLVLSSIFFFFKPLSRKYIILSLLSLLSIPALSWSILFIQGLRISDCLLTLSYIKKLSSADTVKFFYTNLVGVFYSHHTVIKNLKIFGITILNFVVTLGISYPILLFLSNKLRLLKILYTLLLIIPVTFMIFIQNISNESFSWLPFSTVLIGLIFLIKKSRNENELEPEMPAQLNELQKPTLSADRSHFGSSLPLRTLELKDKIFLLIIISAIISSVKSFFFLNLQIYGTITFPLTLLANLIFVMEYLPEFFKFINKKCWQHSWIAVLLAISMIFSLKYYLDSEQTNIYPVKTQKGTIYSDKQTGEVITKTINYINLNLPKNSNFLVIPEGVMLNFLTNRQSDDWYYFLIPVNIEIFNENSIVENLSKNPPDYILLNNRDTSVYNYQYFGKDYGFKIYKFVLENYELKQSFKNDFIIKIYKKKLKRKGK